MPQFPCLICEKAVTKNHKAVCCDVCNKWVHIGYSNINTYTYRKLQKSDAPWSRKECLKKLIPFCNVTNDTLSRLFEWKEIVSPNLDKYLSDDNQILVELGKSIRNKSFTPYELNNYLANKNYECLYLHLNISSLSYHCDDLSSLINYLKVKPKIIEISKCRIKKNKPPLSNIDLTKYVQEQTPTEASKGSTLLYISEELIYKTHKDLQMCKAKELESTFIEILNKKTKNLIVGCIYKHPTLNNQDFIDSYIPLLEKLSYENKQVMLMGDFNMNPLRLQHEY